MTTTTPRALSAVLALAGLTGGAFPGRGLAAVITFEDLALAPESAEDGSGLTPYGTGTVFGTTENFNRFTSGGQDFENRFIPAFATWSGWAYSNRTDTTTPGFLNDLSAYAGGGAGGSANFAVSFNEVNTLALGPGHRAPVSVMVTNVTYPALAMRDGDGFSKQFGGLTGTDPDYLLLEIIGLDAAAGETGRVPVYLADYRTAPFILDEWLEVDLTSLGTDVRTLEFRLTSTDNGVFGINTPTYFALDNLNLIPEPTVAFLALGGVLVSLGRRRR